MNGLQIQFFLGLFFALNSVRFEQGRISGDLAQVVIGAVLIAMAILGFTPLR